MPEVLRCKAECCIHNDHLACRLPALEVVGAPDTDEAGIRCANYHYREHVDNFEENNLVEGGQRVAFVSSVNAGGILAAADPAAVVAMPMAAIELSVEGMGAPTVVCTVEDCRFNRDRECMVKELNISDPSDIETQDASCLSFESRTAPIQ